MSSEPSIVSPGREVSPLRDDLTASLVFGLLPVAMVWLFRWDPRLLIAVIYFDSVLAFFQALPMIVAAKRWQSQNPPSRFAAAGFFALHNGGFTLCFGLMAITLYEMLGPNPPPINADGSYTLDFDLAAMALAVLAKPILLVPPLAWRILRFRRFRARREAERVTVNGMMGFPYIHGVGFWFLAVQFAFAPGAVGHLWGLAIFRVLLDLLEMWLRVRPSRLERAVAAPPALTPPGVHFDVRTARPPILIPLAVGGMFFLFGGIALLLGQWTGVAFMGFAALWTGGALFAVLSPRRKLINALEEGTARTVEGPVENFTAKDHVHGVRSESFTVGGAGFSYSDRVITGAFNRIYAKGGPVHHGLRLRINYVPINDQNLIARLEVL